MELVADLLSAFNMIVFQRVYFIQSDRIQECGCTIRHSKPNLTVIFESAAASTRFRNACSLDFFAGCLPIQQVFCLCVLVCANAVVCLMAPIAPVHSPFFAPSASPSSQIAIDPMQNSLADGRSPSSASGATATAATTGSPPPPPVVTAPTLESLSMTLATRTPNDHVDDTAKLEKMAAAVRVLLEVRT